MTTHEYIDLDKAYDDVEFCIFCEARDSLNLSSRLRHIMDKFHCDKEVLRKELTTYLECMNSRSRELQDILDELNAKEVTE